ncbi:MAG TPA: multicopper oxidase domain-containing protein [Dehalococcoidia bacterium]|nr:multicopper oxidase domain-containing protein [Dehalococcoidia bacterium]
MSRRWIFASWMSIVVAALAAVLMLQHDPGRARAATQYFGPKEAEVTIEDGNVKVVHLTSSKFMWKFRDDQPAVEVWGYNNQIPGPTLHFRAGDHVRIYYMNNLDEASSVHWHGLVVPNSMDGVALLTQPPVMPGETFVYEFDMPDTPGTFMYHAHMDDMEQVGMGLSGGIIIDPKDGGDGKYTQDRLLVLNDIKGHYLINGKEFPNIDPFLVKTGDLLRVRMINISPVESHPMHFHGHYTKVIAQDGMDLASGAAPRVENTVLVAPGQTIDVEVKMNAPGKGAWIWHCHVLAHVMGPDGKSLKLAEANGGMIIPVVYTDSSNIADLQTVLSDAIASIQPAAGTSGAGDAVAAAVAPGASAHAH